MIWNHKKELQGQTLTVQVPLGSVKYTKDIGTLEVHHQMSATQLWTGCTLKAVCKTINSKKHKETFKLDKLD